MPASTRRRRRALPTDPPHTRALELTAENLDLLVDDTGAYLTAEQTA